MRDEIRKIVLSIYATKDLKEPMVDQWINAIMELIESVRDEEFINAVEAINNPNYVYKCKKCNCMTKRVCVRCARVGEEKAVERQLLASAKYYEKELSQQKADLIKLFKAELKEVLDGKLNIRSLKDIIKSLEE